MFVFIACERATSPLPLILLLTTDNLINRENSYAKVPHHSIPTSELKIIFLLSYIIIDFILLYGYQNCILDINKMQ